jgi:hypothetical protein
MAKSIHSGASQSGVLGAHLRTERGDDFVGTPAGFHLGGDARA